MVISCLVSWQISGLHRPAVCLAFFVLAQGLVDFGRFSIPNVGSDLWPYIPLFLFVINKQPGVGKALSLDYFLLTGGIEVLVDKLSVPPLNKQDGPGFD